MKRKEAGFMEWVRVLMQLSIAILMLATTRAQYSQTNPLADDCQRNCGDISIPYPFGTSKGCYIDEEFLVTCNTTHFNPPRAFLRTSNIQILNISLSGQLRILNYNSYDCYDSKGRTDYFESNLKLLKFLVSYTQNKLTVVGCDTGVSIAGIQGQDYFTGCISYCSNLDRVINSSCSGIGCCQSSIPKGIKDYNIVLVSFSNHSKVLRFNPCSYGFVVEDGAYNFSSADFANMTGRQRFPVILDWSIGNQTCREAKKSQTSYACKQNTRCFDADNGPGYLCNCSEGFQGNPYLPNGCQDINECMTLSPCNGTCNNLPGNFSCSCPKGYSGDGYKNGSGCRPIPKHKSPWKDTALGLGTGFGILILLIGAWRLYKVIKRRKRIMLKAKFFKQNGGLLLQQQLSSGEGNVEKTKLITSRELEKATDQYNKNRILGQGGQGTVYKGMLADGRIIAVKKSKIEDKSKLGQFINEVVILSQINHRNVVKLLGYCLETEVPLLVYEFIPNGTLSQHIQNEEFPFAWEMRLQITTEISGALSYLHSAASIPIYHRDIKSTNILLDEKYQAKVADFGTSRSVALDKTHFTTLVQGTFGYLDPEYFHTSKFTDKSDVYSFGVVLVELLTGQKPITSARSDSCEEVRSLAMYFIVSMERNSLNDILDARMVVEGKKEEIRAVANLARRCLNLKGRNRPTMKDVTIELEGIKKSQGTGNIIHQSFEKIDYDPAELTPPWDSTSTSSGPYTDINMA